jgi:hypothetical protein
MAPVAVTDAELAAEPGSRRQAERSICAFFGLHPERKRATRIQSLGGILAAITILQIGDNSLDILFD